jgi:Ca2+-binding RTX toxin-like protein
MAVTVTYNLNTIVPEFTANGWLIGDQYGAEIIGLSNGGFAVVYATDNTDDATGLANDFPWVNVYDTNFNPIAVAEIPAPEGLEDMQGHPEIIELANGNIAVIWKEGANGANKVFGTIIDTSTGAVINQEFTVSNYTNDADPEAAALANGNWVVAMNDAVGVYLQLMDQTGAHIGDPIVINPDGLPFDPAIAALADGGFVVTWTHNANPGNDRIWGQIHNADGSVREASYLIGDSGENNQSAVAGLPNGNWAVVYSDTGWGAGDGISLQIFNPSGTAVSGIVRVDTNLNAVEQDPDITILANGFIVVSWTHPYSATDNDIYARVFDPSGTPIAINGSNAAFVITGSTTDDRDASISSFFGGVFGAVWTDSATDGYGGSITGEINEISRTTTGDAANNTLFGDALRDIMYGGDGNDTLHGNAGDDELHGGDGNDSLRGNAGDDKMYGGTGNDTYFVNDAGDVVIELAGEGFDTIYSSISKTLGANIENLALVGSANLNGTGNALNNILAGNAGNNTLDGGGGVNALVGGEGNDIYVIRNSADIIEEWGGEGTDTVRSYINWTLGANIERLELQGSNNLNGTGNALNNTLVGNSGNNLLNGGDGNDYMVGGVGDDIFVVAAAGDSTIENAGDGTDTVRSYINWTLGANVERLELQGSGNLNGTGNSLNNTLVGNAGNNLLNGGDGNDYMVGGAGNDTLTGGVGNDTLIGGAGSDILNGGTGNDRFDFDLVSNSPAGPGLRDSIVGGFAHGFDLIDLATIDANTLTGGNQAFSFIGSAAFSGVAGQLRYTNYSGNVIIDADVNGDSTADMQILVTGTTFMAGTDFIL